MAVNVVNCGSYEAVRILVGKAQSPYHREYVCLSGLSNRLRKETIEQAKQREAEIKAEYLAQNDIKKGKRNHCFEKMGRANHSIIRGINIYFRKGKASPSVALCFCIMSDGHVESYGRQTQDYKEFKLIYKEAVDRAVAMYGLDRARKGWRTIPVTEEEFYAGMDKAQRGA